ncbi:MAG: Arc family DNA binding domain-containing protein [Candidatus Hinthialibacter sp.]
MAKRKSFLLRLDPKLWEEVEAWANQELRSVNGQIEFILREAVRKRTRRETPQSGDEPDET